MLSQASRRQIIASLLIAVVALGVTGPNVSALSVVTTVPVGVYPSWVAIDQQNNLIYVTNYNPSGAVSVINATTNQVVATIPTGSNPRSIALNPTTNLAYVTNQGSNSLSVIDLSTNLVVYTVPNINAPWHVAVNPTTNRAYVTLSQDGQVAVFDVSTTTPRLIDTLQTGGIPLDIAINTTTNQFYVTDGASTVGTTETVLEFDGTSDSLLASIPVSTSMELPDRLVFNPQTNRLYVSMQTSSLGDNHVAVIDATQNSLIANIALAGVPDGIAVDTATNHIYVGDLTQPYFLWVIDGTANTVIGTVIPGDAPLAVAVNSQTSVAYTANAYGNNVSVVNINFQDFLPFLSN